MTTQNEPGDLVLSSTLQKLIHWWWVVAIFIIAGGLAGLLFSQVRQPLYESTAVITTAIDFAYAGRLTDYEEDHLITAVGDVIKSSDVMDEVIRKLTSEGITIQKDGLSDALALSRQGYRWELSSRFTDAVKAQKINQAWLGSAMIALEEMQLNSTRGLQEYLLQQSMETCFSQAVVLDPVSGYCSALELDELTKSIGNNSTEEGESLINSLHMSGLSFRVTQSPEVASKPVRLQANSLALSGALTGLILAVLFFQLGFPKTKKQG